MDGYKVDNGKAYYNGMIWGENPLFSKTLIWGIWGSFGHLIRYHNIVSPPPKTSKNYTITLPKTNCSFFFVIFGRQLQSNVNISYKNMNQTQPTFTKVHYKSIYTTISLMVQKSQATTRDVQLNLVNNWFFTTNLNW